MKTYLSVLCALFFSTILFAQTTISGTIKEVKTGEPIPGVNIKVAGKSIGTTSDFDGNFVLKLAQNPPISLEISLIT